MKSQEELEKLVEDLSVRLQRVEAVAEIQRLKAEYGRLTDARYDRNGVVERKELERLASEITDCTPSIFCIAQPKRSISLITS